MAAKVKAIPDGASVVIPRLVCRDPAAAMDFYTKAFGAVERVRRPGPDGTVAHAMLTIGPTMIMIEGEWPTLPSRAPTVERAIAGGAQVLVPVQDQCLGRSDRLAHGPVRACLDCGHLYRRNDRARAKRPMVQHPRG